MNLAKTNTKGSLAMMAVANQSFVITPVHMAFVVISELHVFVKKHRNAGN